MSDDTRAREFTAEVEEVLAARVVAKSIRYITAIFGVVLSILGGFGFYVVLDLRKAADALTTEKARLQAQADSLRDKTRALGEYSRELQLQLDTSRSVLEQYQSTLLARLYDLGGAGERVHVATAKAEAIVETLAVHRAALVEEERALRDSVLEFGRTIETLKSVVSTVDQRTEVFATFSSGSYIIGEKNDNSIIDMNIVIRMGAVDGDKRHLAGFTVLDRTATRLLWGPESLYLGQHVVVTVDGYQYELAPRYIISAWFAKDAVGVDIQRTRVANNY